MHASASHLVQPGDDAHPTRVASQHVDALAAGLADAWELRSDGIGSRSTQSPDTTASTHDEVHTHAQWLVSMCGLRPEQGHADDAPRQWRRGVAPMFMPPAVARVRVVRSGPTIADAVETSAPLVEFEAPVASLAFGTEAEYRLWGSSRFGAHREQRGGGRRAAVQHAQVARRVRVYVSLNGVSGQDVASVGIARAEIAFGGLPLTPSEPMARLEQLAASFNYMANDASFARRLWELALDPAVVGSARVAVLRLCLFWCVLLPAPCRA